MGNFREHLDDLILNYIAIRQWGHDLFFCEQEDFGKYLFALYERRETQLKPDGTICLEERDFNTLEKVLPLALYRKIIEKEVQIRPYTSVSFGDRFNLQVLKDVLNNKAVLLRQGKDTLFLD